MFIEIQIPLLFPVCSQFLKICNLEQMASVWKQMFIYKNLPFWFLIVIHDSSSIELYQLCVIWWQPMGGLTTAWQQLNGSFMTITAWRWRLRRLMKSSWELGDRRQLGHSLVADFLGPWRQLHLCLCFFCLTIFFILVIDKNNVPSGLLLKFFKWFSQLESQNIPEQWFEISLRDKWPQFQRAVTVAEVNSCFISSQGKPHNFDCCARRNHQSWSRARVFLFGILRLWIQKISHHQTHSMYSPFTAWAVHNLNKRTISVGCWCPLF